jgi:hypothetical protein
LVQVQVGPPTKTKCYKFLFYPDIFWITSGLLSIQKNAITQPFNLLLIIGEYMLKKIYLIIFVIFLSGCAGVQFTWDEAKSVKINDSKEVLIEKMGAPPYMVTTMGSKEIWVWTWATGFGSVKSVSFIIENGVVAATPTIPFTSENGMAIGVTAPSATK